MKTREERLAAMSKLQDAHTNRINDQDYLPVILFGVNDNYEAYGDSATFVSQILGLPLCLDEPPMVSFPHGRLINWGYLSKLTRLGGYSRIIVLDELQTPPKRENRITDLVSTR